MNAARPPQGTARVNILGVLVNNISLEQAVDKVEEFVHSGGLHYVCVSNVHTVTMCQADEEYRRIHNEASMVTPDGTPLMRVMRMMGYEQPWRVYGPDLMLAHCARSVATGTRHYFFGGKEGVPEKLAAVMQEKFPGIQIAGTYSPPFRALTPEEDEALVQMINNSGANVLWVGLGAPKQELWMGSHHGRIKVPVMLGVGAAFDFHTGSVRQAPAWVQRISMEWFFRLLMEPRRLWRRYVFNNPMFVLLVTLQLLGLRKYEIEN